jgi:K+-sensing histidine kinase KdpD
MSKHTDAELIDELKKRFEENAKALHDLQVLTRKLELMNEKLVESESLKSNFISNIKNELNNPLTSLLIMSKQIISAGTCNREICAEVANSIYSDIFTIDFHLRNIFSAAEIESGGAMLSISRVNIDHLIKGTIDMFSHITSKKRIAVNFLWLENQGEPGHLFNTDSEKVQIIISNLLWNSIEYSNEDSNIFVKAWVTGEHLNVLIEDQGFIIPESEQATVFSGFKHLSVDLTKKERGNCLGLAVTKSLVDILGGSISVTCTEGNGCIFSIFIPSSKSESTNAFSEGGNEFFFEDNDTEKF